MHLQYQKIYGVHICHQNMLEIHDLHILLEWTELQMIIIEGEFGDELEIKLIVMNEALQQKYEGNDLVLHDIIYQVN